ncbi:hypothetical protein [Neptunomonas sp. XY-337]|uniref:hypothetical protein n=1 Tax=Neptunomonas sp. XY-337 TaxID=2561897 RepID=UPI0010A99BF7|nr:hypothetical protein [Neptunomonas sp. XY-337]
MKAIPMLFNAEMVNALLNGAKTQTRRPIKFPVRFSENTGFNFTNKDGKTYACGIGFSWESTCRNFIEGKSPYQVGDLIYVRETFRLFNRSDECGCSEAPCPCPPTDHPIYRATHDCSEALWKPSIHMPRWASRITLRVTNVRVERLTAISEADATAEGFDYSETEAAIAAGWYEKPRKAFRRAWESMYGEESWVDDAWIWVIDFEVIRENIDAVMERGRQ